MDLSAFTFEALLPFIAIGFAAQLLDGALGMAFGVISNTLLISMGVPPAAASAGVHAAESFTTGASGISHIAHRNVDWKLFRRLVIPGVAGGVLGAYILSSVNAEAARPFVLAYLCAIGLYLLWRGIRFHPTEKTDKFVAPLGLVGGFLDAAGGGGWGAVVTSNLLVQGGSPRKVVGTVNTVEFFLAVAISATFIFTPRSRRIHHRHGWVGHRRRRRCAARGFGDEAGSSQAAAHPGRNRAYDHQPLRSRAGNVVVLIGFTRQVR